MPLQSQPSVLKYFYHVWCYLWTAAITPLSLKICDLGFSPLAKHLWCCHVGCRGLICLVQYQIHVVCVCITQRSMISEPFPKDRGIWQNFLNISTHHTQGSFPNLPARGQCINLSSFHPPPTRKRLCAMWVSDEQTAKGVSIARFHHTHPRSKLGAAASRCSSPRQTSVWQSASRWKSLGPAKAETVFQVERCCRSSRAKVAGTPQGALHQR